ncbi:MAG TPA: hemolysin family protein [Candidatus Omnitrophota bacterium]|nr:hemolysin family protein [Candidatus Omnitrophota bacterium]
MLSLHEIFVVLILLIASAFFSAAETAIFSLSPIERRRILQAHPKKGKIVQYLLERPRRTLITILIGNNLVNILGSAVVSLLAIRFFGKLGVGVAIALFTVLLIIFGEIIPKALAVRHNERISSGMAYALHFIAKILFPIREAVRWITDWTLSFLVREKVRETDRISDRELQSLIQIGAEEGVLDQDEAKRLSKLFELGERSVNEIMTPRTEMIAFDIQQSRDDLEFLLRNYHYTHIPVYQENLDNILGVIFAQEVMLYSERSIRQLLRDPYHVPETKRIDELLFEMRKTKVHCALCVDEYGGTAGLVTLEDILEEIFGEIYDEYAQEEKKVARTGKDECLVDGLILLKDFNEIMGTEFVSEGSETLGGFIFEQLGRIPKLKEAVKIGHFIFEVRELDKQRIAKIFAKKVV